MQVIDASSVVLAWDIYPIKQFPRFWNWLDDSIKSKFIVMADPNATEVRHVSPDCHAWLSSRITLLPMDNAVVQQALMINQLLGVVNGEYHPKGVDENDVICIAAAKTYNFDVISDEALQTSKPVDLKRYKIPAVCQLADVDIRCLHLNQLIRTSGHIF